jgi:hypothetical protein
MASDNRISAVLSDEQVVTVQGALTAIREVLPFLVTLAAQERRELPRLGPKSVGFDEKCVTYMANRAQFVPGFVDLAEVQKDRNPQPDAAVRGGAADTGQQRGRYVAAGVQ